MSEDTRVGVPEQGTPPVDSDGVFSWGDEDEAVPPELIAPRTRARIQIIGVPEVKCSNDPSKTSLWLEVTVVAPDYPTSDPIIDRLFFPDVSSEPRQRNRQLTRLQEFKGCFGWTPPAGRPRPGDQYPELSEAVGEATIGIEKDRRGEYPDRNKISHYEVSAE